MSHLLESQAAQATAAVARHVLLLRYALAVANEMLLLALPTQQAPPRPRTCALLASFSGRRRSLFPIECLADVYAAMCWSSQQRCFLSLSLVCFFPPTAQKKNEALEAFFSQLLVLATAIFSFR